MLKYLYILTAVTLFSFLPKPVIALEIAVAESPIQNATEKSGGKIVDLRQAKQRALEVFRIAAQTKKIVDRIKAKGGVIPAEYEPFLNSLADLTDNFVKNAEEGTGIGEMIENIEKGAGQIEMVVIPTLSSISEWQNTLKDAQKELISLNRQFERAKKKIDRKETKEIDAEKIALSIQLSFSAANDALVAADNMVKEGDAKNAFILYRETADKKIKELSDKINVFENVLNISLLIKKMDIETARIERRVRQLNAEKSEIKALTDIISAIKEKRGEINKNLGKAEEVFNVLVWFENAKRNAENKIGPIEEKNQNSSSLWWF